MSATCALLAVRIYRSARARRIAFTLLAAQALFSVVKLTVYHESASFVFLAVIAATATALGVRMRPVRYARRSGSRQNATICVTLIVRLRPGRGASAVT